MRSVVDFYRARPVILVLVLVIGIAVAVGTTSLKGKDAVVLPIVFVALIGIVVGSLIGAAQRGRG
jgi:ABC-type transport system involved in multi-copper enzyme maturation permease subunit